jgi:ferredoxin
LKEPKRSRQIKAYPEKCAGCFSCALACSFAFTQAFNPLKARITINYPGDVARSIRFTGDCNACGLCVEHCNFGALEVIES